MGIVSLGFRALKEGRCTFLVEGEFFQWRHWLKTTEFDVSFIHREPFRSNPEIFPIKLIEKHVNFTDMTSSVGYK